MNGIDCFMRGFSLVAEPGLRRYVVIPGILNTIVLILLVGFSAANFDGWVASLSGWLPDWLSFLESIIWFVALIVVFLTLLYAFIMIASLLASPFNAILSEKVEERISGSPPSSSVSLAMIVPRAIGREIAKLLYLLPRLIGLFVISLVPGLNAVSPFLWLMFGSWMMAVQFADYAADNNDVGFSDLRRRLASKRLNAVLFGLPAYLLMAIPLVNIIILPVAVAGGTAYWCEHLKENRNLKD